MSHISDIPEGRLPDGRFGPGNRSGRGRVPLPQAFKEQGPQLIANMLEIANDRDHDKRFEATKWCVERIYGKPIAEVEVSGDDAINELIAKLARSEPEQDK